MHVDMVDAFGIELAARLASLAPDGARVTSYPQGDADAAAVETDLLVVAAAHPIPRICDTLDEICFRRGTPWIQVVHEAGGVTLGPLIVPGKGACYACYRRRAAQHAVDGDITETVMNFYGARPDAGPEGFFPPASSLAAAAIVDLAGRLQKGDCRDAGQVRTFDLLGWETTTSWVVGVHGCKRCGRPRNEARRAIEALSNWAAQLSGVLS